MYKKLIRIYTQNSYQNLINNSPLKITQRYRRCTVYSMEIEKKSKSKCEIEKNNRNLLC